MWRLLHRLFGFTARLRQRQFSDVVAVDQATGPLPPTRQDRILVVSAETKPKWLRFLCPCGCNEEVALNLMRTHSPHWTISQDNAKRLSVTPSIHSSTCG